MTEDEKARARLVLSGMYWQPAEGHNYRYRGANRTLTRFFESASMEADAVKLLLEYLRDEEITNSISLAGRRVDLGTGWKAMDVWYQTSAGDKWSGTDSTRIRIYQTLMQAPVGSDAKDGPYAVENGCQYLVTHEFYWNVTTLPTLSASSSGIQYTLQGVTRDRETGLYSCVIEKRERVQQDVALTAASGTIFETKSEEQHLGVKQANVASTGLQQSAGNGVIVTRQIRKNPDCTSDVLNEKTVEHPIGNAVVVYEKTLRGTRQTVTDRNQTGAVSATGMVVGERRTSRRTEGGRYDNETSKLSAQPAGVIATECSKDAFQHDHATTTNQSTAPGSDVSDASGGVVHTRSSTKNEDGTIDVRERTVTEKNVQNAVIVIRKTIRGTIESVTHRGSAEALDGTGVELGETRKSEKTPGGLWNNTTEKLTGNGAGQIGETCEHQTYLHVHTTTVNQKGEPTPIERTPEAGKVIRRQVQHNDGGTVDVIDTIETHGEKTASASYGSVLATARIIVRNDTLNQAPSTVPGINRSVSFDVSPSDRGTFSTREVVTNHVPSSVSVSTGSTVARTVTTVKRNDTNASVTEAPAVNRSVDASVSPNDHGSFDKTVRVTDYSPTVSTASSTWATERVVTTTTRHNSSKQATASMGEASADPDDNGGATTRVTEATPIPVDSGWITWNSQTRLEHGTYKYRHGIRIFKNLTAAPEPPSGSNCSLNININKFGRYDGSISYSDLVSWEKNSGGTSGGIQNGQATFWQFKTDPTGKSWKRRVTVQTIHFYGSGNEGTRAYYAANPVLVSGLSLNGGTFAKGGPVYGNWQESN